MDEDRNDVYEKARKRAETGFSLLSATVYIVIILALVILGSNWFRS